VSDSSHRSQRLPPQQSPTGNNRQRGEHQAEGHAHYKTERLDPSRYEHDGQNIGDENVGVELDSVWHDARDLSLIGIYCHPALERVAGFIQ